MEQIIVIDAPQKYIDVLNNHPFNDAAWQMSVKANTGKDAIDFLYEKYNEKFRLYNVPKESLHVMDHGDNGMFTVYFNKLELIKPHLSEMSKIDFPNHGEFQGLYYHGNGEYGLQFRRNKLH